MALKVNSSRKPDPAIDDQDVSRELEEALALDLTGDLDMDSSMEDLELQISQAAEELAREGRGDHQPVAETSVVEQPVAIEQPRSDASMQFDPIAGATEDDTLDLDDALLYSGAHAAAEPVAPQAAAAAATVAAAPLVEPRPAPQPKPQPQAQPEFGTGPRSCRGHSRSSSASTHQQPYSRDSLRTCSRTCRSRSRT